MSLHQLAINHRSFWKLLWQNALCWCALKFGGFLFRKISITCFSNWKIHDNPWNCWILTKLCPIYTLKWRRHQILKFPSSIFIIRILIRKMLASNITILVCLGIYHAHPVLYCTRIDFNVMEISRCYQIEFECAAGKIMK